MNHEENKYIKPIHTYLGMVKFEEIKMGEWVFLIDKGREYSSIRYSIEGKVIYISHNIINMICKLLGFEPTNNQCENICKLVSDWVIKENGISVELDEPKMGYQVLLSRLKRGEL